MAKYNNILALANQVKPKTEESEQDDAVRENNNLTTNNQTSFVDGITSGGQVILAEPIEPRPQPDLTRRFQASVLQFRLLGEAWLVLAERIQKGKEFVRKQPSNLDAIRLLNQLKREQAELQKRLDQEAVMQYELEREIVAIDGGRAICTQCWQSYDGESKFCECYANAVKCEHCGLPIVDAVVDNPRPGGGLYSLSAERIVEITTEKTGGSKCLACYRAGNK